MRFMTFKENFTQNTFISFLGRMLRKARKKIFLIVDNHRSHHAKKVQEWLQKRKDRIEVYFLPAYCPEMNPTELLNQDLKSNAFRGKLFKNQKEVDIATRVYLSVTVRQRVHGLAFSYSLFCFQGIIFGDRTMRPKTQADWDLLLEEYRTSNETQKAFCSRHHIGLSTLKGKLYSKRKLESKKEAHFLPVTFATSPNPTSSLELTTKDGLSLKFDSTLPPSYIAELLIALS